MSMEQKKAITKRIQDQANVLSELCREATKMGLFVSVKINQVQLFGITDPVGIRINQNIRVIENTNYLNPKQVEAKEKEVKEQINELLVQAAHEAKCSIPEGPSRQQDAPAGTL